MLFLYTSGIRIHVNNQYVSIIGGVRYLANVWIMDVLGASSILMHFAGYSCLLKLQLDYLITPELNATRKVNQSIVKPFIMLPVV